MMVFHIHKFICCIKFRVFLEKGIIQKTDMYRGFYIQIIFSPGSDYQTSRFLKHLRLAAYDQECTNTVTMSSVS